MTSGFRADGQHLYLDDSGHDHGFGFGGTPGTVPNQMPVIL
jgi:hypothetical protein